MKKCSRSFLLSVLFLLPLINTAQNTGQADYSNSITTEELKDHIYYLASDELGGRLTGSTYFDIAADYAITQFKQAGLKPICLDSLGNRTFKQLILFDKYEATPNDSMIFEKDGEKKVYKSPMDYTYYQVMNNTQETISGNVVFAGYGLHEPGLNWDDFEGLNIQNKWVAIFLNWKEKYNKDYKTKIKDSGKSIHELIHNSDEFIKNSEAKGILFIADKELLDSWDTWAPFSNIYVLAHNNQNKLPNGTQWIIAGPELTNKIFGGEEYDPVNSRGEYKTLAFKNLNISLKKDIQFSKITSPNVVAYIEGSDPDLKNEFVILGAHLDHLGIISGAVMNGADDNASGSTSVLEIAEAVALSDPKRSVAFILFTGEEKGLLGSKYFVDHCPINLDSIQLYINLDMVGRSDGEASDIAPVGYNMGTINLKDVLNKVNSESVHVNLDFACADSSKSDIYKSDQYWFYNNSIPVVDFSSREHDDYHKSTDDAEKIDFELMRKVDVLTYDLIMEVANSEESLRKK